MRKNNDHYIVARKVEEYLYPASALPATKNNSTTESKYNQKGWKTRKAK